MSGEFSGVWAVADVDADCAVTVERVVKALDASGARLRTKLEMRAVRWMAIV